MVIPLVPALQQLNLKVIVKVLLGQALAGKWGWGENKAHSMGQQALRQVPGSNGKPCNPNATTMLTQGNGLQQHSATVEIDLFHTIACKAHSS
jgi:hypothetical protein